MSEVLNIVVGFLALFIYGTEERPRHPAIRNTVRVIAFGGAVFVIASGLNVLPDVNFDLGLVTGWIVSFLIVLAGEYELGSKRIAYAIFFTGFILIVVNLYSAASS